MIKTCGGDKRFTSNVLNFQSSFRDCLRTLIDFNDAWFGEESIIKQAAVDLNSMGCQGQQKGGHLTEIQLNQNPLTATFDL